MIIPVTLLFLYVCDACRPVPYAVYARLAAFVDYALPRLGVAAVVARTIVGCRFP